MVAVINKCACTHFVKKMFSVFLRPTVKPIGIRYIEEGASNGMANLNSGGHTTDEVDRILDRGEALGQGRAGQGRAIYIRCL